MKKLPALLVTLGIAATSVALSAPAASATSSSGRDSADRLYLLESNGTLSTRDADLPLLPGHRVKIRGLQSGDRLVGLDTRPATGQLYALGKSGQLYRLDAHSGRATAVGTPAAGTVGSAVGFDFNPTVDRIRVVTESGRNLRLHPDTGALAATDTPLAYAGSKAKPAVGASAYTDSFAGATSTGLYGLDSDRDTLVVQGSLPGATPVVSPNTGQLSTVGRLGVNVTSVNGFDIDGRARKAGSYDARDYDAIAAVRTGLLSKSTLVKVDLRTGRTTKLIALGLGEVVGLTYSAR